MYVVLLLLLVVVVAEMEVVKNALQKNARFWIFCVSAMAPKQNDAGRTSYERSTGA